MRIWAKYRFTLRHAVLNLNRVYFILGLSIMVNLSVFCPGAFAIEMNPALAPTVTEVQNTGPQVFYTFPQSNAVSVKTSSKISVTFDTEMEASSFTSSSFVVQRDGKENIPVSSIIYDDLTKTAVFTPFLQLQTDTSYKVTLTTEIKSKSAVPLASNFEWSFTTGKVTEPLSVSTAPKVTFTAPVSDEVNVGLKQNITVHFDSVMDEKTITDDTFWVALEGSGDSVKLPGAIQLAADSFKFTPKNQLEPDKKYKVTLKKGITSDKGESLEDYSWTFTTVNQEFASEIQAFTEGNSDYSFPHGFYQENPNACQMCHQAHTASGNSLLNRTEQTNVCFTCHDGSGSSKSILTATEEGYMSYHPIKDTKYATANPNVEALECSTCHNPHGDKDDTGVYYPNLLRVTDGTKTIYSGVDFCIACHKSTNDKLGIENDKSDYKTSYHYTEGNVSCNQCHSPHSSTNSQLQAWPKDQIRISDTGAKQLVEGECLQCHAKSGLPNNPTNVGQDFLKVSGHNPKICTECHEPHSSSKVKSDCVSCHSSTLEDETESDFSESDGSNLHSKHPDEMCTSCHQPHGSDFRKSVVLNSEFSTRVITSFNTANQAMPEAGNWIYDSCNTKCHTQKKTIAIPSTPEASIVIDPITPSDTNSTESSTVTPNQSTDPPISESQSPTVSTHEPESNSVEPTVDTSTSTSTTAAPSSSSSTDPPPSPLP